MTASERIRAAREEAMSPLNQRLDEIGWNDLNGHLAAQQEHLSLMYRWMHQATAEIDRLQDQVDRLSKKIES